jgi:serine/threonine protein kinase
MIGEKLSPYTILEIIGNGSMGTVYRVEGPTGRLVALELVRSQALNRLERSEHFLLSAPAANRIRHPGKFPNEKLNGFR